MNLIMKDFEEHFLAHHPGHVHLEPGATAHSGSSIRRLTSASRHFSLRQPCLPTSVPPVCSYWTRPMEDQNCPLNSVTSHIIYVCNIPSFVILCSNHLESVNFPNPTEFAAATSLIELLSVLYNVTPPSPDPRRSDEL